MENSNALFVIKPYRWNGTWVFDDADVGLVREPFVSGMPAIIDGATKDLRNPENGFIAIFSAHPFPGFNVELKWVREEYSGNWYEWVKNNQEGWLCPALLKYYDKAPKQLFIRVESLP